MTTALVVQTSFLGDVVLTTPLIAHLAAAGPVDVVATAQGAALLENNPAIREVVVYDKRHRDRGLRGFRRLSGKLRAGRYDAAYMAQGSVRSGALAFAARIPRRVGFTTSAGRPFYNVRVLNVEGTHHARRLLALASESSTETRPRLYPGDRERQAVDALLGNATAFVVLAPGSVWATKRWPGYPELARLLASRARIVVIGSADDRDLAAEIQNAVPESINAAGTLSLLASAELVRRAAVLVTNDSLPQHLASAMNTPTVTVFGPTVPEFGFGPLADRSAVAGRTDLACRPCHPHGPERCPLRHWRCMREITAHDVATLVGEVTSRLES